MIKMDTSPQLETFSKFLKEFQDESDRGAAIIAGSMLDDKLKTVLSDFFIETRQTKELLEGASSPLSTFNTRLNLAYCLGLISDIEYEDCNIIRRIRNDFAHKFELDFSFNDQKVKDLCWNLKADTPGDKSSFRDKPRQLFVNAVVSLCVNWLYREEHVKKRRLKRPDWHAITWDGEK